MKIPTITVDGKIYKPKCPKAKVWRRVLTFQQHEKDIQAEDYMEEMAEVIAEAFGNENVTKESILNNIDLMDMRDLFSDVFIWFVALLNGKMEEIPKNVKAETEI